MLVTNTSLVSHKIRSNFLYGATDDLFVKRIKKRKSKIGFRFKLIPLLDGRLQVDRNDITIRGKTSPDKLTILAGIVVDRIPLPQPRKWTNVEVCNWIKKIGFPQYQDTLRANLINGRTLLLLEASQLVAINITNFNDIQRITSAIRHLYEYEFTFFCRSIALSPKPPDSHYKDYRVKTGLVHDDTRPTDLFRMMRIIGSKPEYALHFQLLEKYLEHNPPYEDIPANSPQLRRWKRLYRPHYCQLPKETIITPTVFCNCIPPCECFWTDRDYALPTVLKTVKQPRPFKCLCAPPHLCGWDKMPSESTIGLLMENNPRKYRISFAKGTIPYARLESRKHYTRIFQNKIN